MCVAGLGVDFVRAMIWDCSSSRTNKMYHQPSTSPLRQPSPALAQAMPSLVYAEQWARHRHVYEAIARQLLLSSGIK